FQTTVHILDDGVGIFKKIKDYFGFGSLDDAIIELSKGKLTTDKQRHSGEGIFFTSRIMDDFCIYSDQKAYFFNKYEEENTKDFEIDQNGATYVLLRLSNSSKKQLRDVFDRYTNDDGDFSKTTIPIKNIIGATPISRSQAKRVCSRLENFKEVEIDFTDVDFIGQGFAHEMFVVFANNHPDVKLIPTNMNDDIRKMHRHVLA
ncbi:MAG: STAS-like domain-containing protein, partial [Clostridia bacterium]|nr:STAS-like domain-containing protein [Clostridia bacterium]